MVPNLCQTDGVNDAVDNTDYRTPDDEWCGFASGKNEEGKDHSTTQ